MQAAVPMGRGAMSAVMGLDADILREICGEAGGVCAPANINAPGQVVISGESESVERAGTLARARGAAKVIPLKVSAPFHCDLMRPVAEDLKAEFSKLKWSDPVTPIVANVDSSPLSSALSVQGALYSQTYSPVLWSGGVKFMESAGVSLFLEFGPGSVLSGLIKRICKGKKTVAVNKSADIGKAVDAIEEISS
jgi:[acyl-carrier-protein] S-malonyltransferase